MSFLTYFDLMAMIEKLSPTIVHVIFLSERTGHVSRRFVITLVNKFLVLLTR